ncbi:hypothetical protein Plhal304r1_c015g0055021 [Plasmopara halstedii]
MDLMRNISLWWKLGRQRCRKHILVFFQQVFNFWLHCFLFWPRGNAQVVHFRIAAILKAALKSLGLHLQQHLLFHCWTSTQIKLLRAPIDHRIELAQPRITKDDVMVLRQRPFSKLEVFEHFVVKLDRFSATEYFANWRSCAVKTLGGHFGFLYLVSCQTRSNDVMIGTTVDQNHHVLVVESAVYAQ